MEDQLSYDFTIESKQQNSKQFDLKPSLEYECSKLIAKVFLNYEEKYKDLFYAQWAPKDSLNRFFYEQLSLPTDDTCTMQVNKLRPNSFHLLNTIDKEIYATFPLTRKLSSGERTLFSLKKYIKECIRIGHQFHKENRVFSSNSTLKMLLNTDMFSSTFFDSVLSARDVFTKPFRVLIEARIKTMKEFLYDELQSLVDSIHKIKNLDHLDVIKQSDHYEIRYRDAKFKLTKFHHNKVKQLFDIHNPNNLSGFKEKLYCLVSRYQTFFKYNEYKNEGHGMQAALPDQVFKVLHDEFGVTQEMFASPFNCYFKRYCSAFADTDSCFGSNGSFFDYEPAEGCLYLHN